MKANKSPRPLKVAVMLSQPFRGSALNGAKNAAKVLVLGSREEGTSLTVVFSCFSDFCDLEKELSDLRELNIEIKKMKWEIRLKNFGI